MTATTATATTTATTFSTPSELAHHHHQQQLQQQLHQHHQRTCPFNRRSSNPEKVELWNHFLGDYNLRELQSVAIAQASHSFMKDLIRFRGQRGQRHERERGQERVQELDQEQERGQEQGRELDQEQGQGQGQPQEMQVQQHIPLQATQQSQQYPPQSNQAQPQQSIRPKFRPPPSSVEGIVGIRGIPGAVGGLESLGGLGSLGGMQDIYHDEIVPIKIHNSDGVNDPTSPQPNHANNSNNANNEFLEKRRNHVEMEKEILFDDDNNEEFDDYDYGDMSGLEGVVVPTKDVGGMSSAPESPEEDEGADDCPITGKYPTKKNYSLPSSMSKSKKLKNFRVHPFNGNGAGAEKQKQHVTIEEQPRHPRSQPDAETKQEKRKPARRLSLDFLFKKNTKSNDDANNAPQEVEESGDGGKEGEEEGPPTTVYNKIKLAAQSYTSPHAISTATLQTELMSMRTSDISMDYAWEDSCTDLNLQKTPQEDEGDDDASNASSASNASYDSDSDSDSYDSFAALNADPADPADQVANGYNGHNGYNSSGTLSLGESPTEDEDECQSCHSVDGGIRARRRFSHFLYKRQVSGDLEGCSVVSGVSGVSGVSANSKNNPNGNVSAAEGTNGAAAKIGYSRRRSMEDRREERQQKGPNPFAFF